MSVRLEWTEAQYAGPCLYKKGDELADGNIVTKEAALGIADSVIEGTIPELAALISKARVLLDKAS